MKYFLPFFLILFSGQLYSQPSIHDLSVENFKNETVRLAAYKGQKMLVVVVSLSGLQKGKITSLDSLQKAYPKVKMITMPIAEAESTDSIKVREVGEKPKSSITVSRAEKVKKSDSRQNPLMKWLTHVDDNTHFDAEVNTDEQYYFISESGVLYAVLEKGAPNELITELLNQPDVTK